MWRAFGNSDSKARLKSVHACGQWRVYELRPSPRLVCFPGKTSSSTAPPAFFASADRRCIAPSVMEITRVKIALSDDERIKAYATITIDDCFVIQGLRLTHSQKGYFLFMPGRKRADGTYVDVVLPLSNETRQRFKIGLSRNTRKLLSENCFPRDPNASSQL
jgi:stage V sporulation protein G